MKILIIFYTFGMGTMIPPNEDDWETCRKFVKFLKLFYNATKRFSSSLYVTSNAFFDEIYMIKRNIDLFSRSDDHFLYSMEEKFDKYWGSEEDSSKKGNVLLYVAVVLDPRKKLRSEEHTSELQSLV